MNEYDEKNLSIKNTDPVIQEKYSELVFEMPFVYHKTHPLGVYNSKKFSIFTDLCKRHHCLTSERFQHAVKITYPRELM